LSDTLRVTLLMLWLQSFLYWHMVSVSLQLLQLLLKASQDKRFVCEEAERTLTGMTTSISPQPMLQKLQPYVSHRNPRVRAKAAMCMHNSVSRLVCTFDECLAWSLCCDWEMSKLRWYMP
jgi:hypothetical protein